MPTSMTMTTPVASAVTRKRTVDGTLSAAHESSNR